MFNNRNAEIVLKLMPTASIKCVFCAFELIKCNPLENNVLTRDWGPRFLSVGYQTLANANVS